MRAGIFVMISLYIRTAKSRISGPTSSIGMLKLDTAVMCRDILDTSETTSPGPRAAELQLPSVII